jgi:hypothetical protein
VEILTKFDLQNFSPSASHSNLHQPKKFTVRFSRKQRLARNGSPRVLRESHFGYARLPTALNGARQTKPRCERCTSFKRRTYSQAAKNCGWLS